MITKMMLGLITPSFTAIERVKAQSYWRQCQRVYRFQPIYRTTGKLLGIELLTGVFHPANPHKFISPEEYFVAIAVATRLQIVQEQLDLLQLWQHLFIHHELMDSIHVDAQVLQLM